MFLGIFRKKITLGSDSGTENALLLFNKSKRMPIFCYGRITMNSCTQHCIADTSGFDVPNYYENDFGGLSDLRRILSRQGFHADETQERMLLELIQQSHCLRR